MDAYTILLALLKGAGLAVGGMLAIRVFLFIAYISSDAALKIVTLSMITIGALALLYSVREGSLTKYEASETIAAIAGGIVYCSASIPLEFLLRKIFGYRPKKTA